MSELDRSAPASLIDQIVAAVQAAIGAGELEAGDKLPPTRELAELAGVNHLTAVRAYRRAAELGLVTSQVGSGTFVRDSAPIAAAAGAGDGGPEDCAWQRFVLPQVAETESDRVLTEMYRHAQAKGLIPLSVGYPSAEMFPYEDFGRALAEAAADRETPALQYTDIGGLPPLINEIAKLSESRGVPEDPADLIVTTGARQGLTLVCRAVLRPGDVAVVESPTFMGVLESLRAVGARVIEVPVDEDGFDVDLLEQVLAQEQVRLVALQSRLNNPTGADLSPERGTRLLDLAHRHGFFVLEDGVYSDLRLEGDEPEPLRPRGRGHVISVDSLSKVVGGGLRVGWVAASGPVHDRILAEKRDDDLHSSTLSQLTLARFLAAGSYPAQRERARAFHRERRDALCEAIDAELGEFVAPLVRPAGGGHLWLTARGNVDERRLLSEAVRHGVTFVPGEAMTVDPPVTARMRLSFGFLSPDELTEGVGRLARAFRALDRAGEAGRERALPIA